MRQRRTPEETTPEPATGLVTRGQAMVRSLGPPATWPRASWAAAVVVAAGCAVGSFVAGFTPIRVAGIVALVALAVGRALHAKAPRTAPDPVVVMGAGIAILAVAGGGIGVPSRSLAAAAVLLAAYGLLLWGAVGLFSARVRGRQADLLLEAAVSALATGVALWAVASHPGANPRALVALVMVPALDAGLCTIFAQMALLPGERVASARYLLLAAGYLLGAHATTSLLGASRSAWMATPLMLLVVVAFAFVGIAALDKSSEVLEERLLHDPPELSIAHVVIVMLTMLAGPATVAMQAIKRVPVSAPTGVAVALVSVLLAVYMGNLLFERADSEHRSNHDELTNLPNRTLLVDRLSRAIDHAQRAGTEVSVMFVDLDEFKAVNDTYGHAAGDILLGLVAARLRGCLREEDTVARLGGDEFVLLLPHVDGLDGTVTVAQRVRKCFRDPFPVDEHRLSITASIGVSLYPHDADNAADLVSAADEAMYRVKAEGRDAYAIFSSDLASRADERLAIETGVLAAIETGQLVVYYQPSIDLESGLIVGAEALVRWIHPERGLIPPDEFIPVAERSELIVAIGDWVLAETCEQMERWRLAGLGPITVAVNVSARQLRHGIAQRVATALRSTGVDPSHLVLELTETATAGDIDLVAVTLGEVRSMGVRWAIDDFGTGYCGLSYLSRLPVDALKIDKSFVQGRAAADQTIVSAVVALGHTLGMTVVAEGVETESQLAHLRSLQCDRAQGYLFGRPMPAADFEVLLRRQAAGAVPSLLPGLTDPPQPPGVESLGRPGVGKVIALTPIHAELA